MIDLTDIIIIENSENSWLKVSETITISWLDMYCNSLSYIKVYNCINIAISFLKFFEIGIGALVKSPLS